MGAARLSGVDWPSWRSVATYSGATLDGSEQMDRDISPAPLPAGVWTSDGSVIHHRNREGGTDTDGVFLCRLRGGGCYVASVDIQFPTTRVGTGFELAGLYLGSPRVSLRLSRAFAEYSIPNQLFLEDTLIGPGYEGQWFNLRVRVIGDEMVIWVDGVFIGLADNRRVGRYPDYSRLGLTSLGLNSYLVTEGAMFRNFEVYEPDWGMP